MAVAFDTLQRGEEIIRPGQSAITGAIPPSLAGRPGILIVGPRSVGKRTIVNRLISTESHRRATSTEGVTCHSWMLDTKYYTADVSVWVASVEDEGPTWGPSRSRALAAHCEALVMVFDLSNDASFVALQQWAAITDLSSNAILICVANKADRVPDHPAHVAYRRSIARRQDHEATHVSDFGIQRTDGSSLLSEEQDIPKLGNWAERRSLYAEWCADHGIEYLEACAMDLAFDQAISTHGDLQGLQRIKGALAAHLWPGLIMKMDGPMARYGGIASGGVGDFQDGTSDDEGHAQLDYEEEEDDDEEVQVEYELLSNAAEPWDSSGEPWHGQFHPHYAQEGNVDRLGAVGDLAGTAGSIPLVQGNGAGSGGTDNSVADSYSMTSPGSGEGASSVNVGFVGHGSWGQKFPETVPAGGVAVTGAACKLEEEPATSSWSVSPVPAGNNGAPNRLPKRNSSELQQPLPRRYAPKPPHGAPRPQAQDAAKSNWPAVESSVIAGPMRGQMSSSTGFGGRGADGKVPNSGTQDVAEFHLPDQPSEGQGESMVGTGSECSIAVSVNGGQSPDSQTGPQLGSASILPEQGGTGNELERLSQSETRGNGNPVANLEAVAGDELEKLMMDMAAVRANMRGMPDSARREVAAALAMRMARLFGEEDVGEGDSANEE